MAKVVTIPDDLAWDYTPEDNMDDTTLTCTFNCVSPQAKFRLNDLLSYIANAPAPKGKRRRKGKEAKRG